ncbi:MAG TPA: hypothetical protein VLA37_10505 [Sphingomonadaceae bacterium]|nr:hypothetical protein [Sphingomonadaceae bacterium]
MLLVMAGAMAMALPDGETNLARDIERNLSRDVVESNLAAVWYEAFVDPQGLILSCDVRGVIGDVKAAASACEEIVGMKVAVARNSNGEAVHGSFLGSVVLADGTQLEKQELEADIVLPVRSLEKPVRSNVVVEVDREGAVSACEPADGVLDAYARTACAEAKTVALPVKRSAGGEAVEYVFPLTFEFRDSTELAMN